jgi:hypothetical protein
MFEPGRILPYSKYRKTQEVAMRHPRLERWETELKAVFNRIDDRLEEKYGHLYPLHPARPGRGKTASKAQDGLFNIGASYSAGFGSGRGAGYVVEVRMVTLSRVPGEVRRRIEEEAVELLRRELPTAFPGRDLEVVRDGNLYKIYGDLSF